MGWLCLFRFWVDSECHCGGVRLGIFHHMMFRTIQYKNQSFQNLISISSYLLLFWRFFLKLFSPRYWHCLILIAKRERDEFVDLKPDIFGFSLFRCFFIKYWGKLINYLALGRHRVIPINIYWWRFCELRVNIWWIYQAINHFFYLYCNQIEQVINRFGFY